MDTQILGENKCFYFTWVIENFSLCWHKKGEKILSPTFTAGTIRRSKWKLILYPNGISNKKDAFISVFLTREEESKGPTNLEIFFELSFLASDNSVFASSGVYPCSFSRGKTGGFSEIVNKELLRIKREQFLPEDTLTVRCRMWKKFGQISKDIQCFARTQVEVVRNSFVWTISEFSLFQKDTLQIGYLTSDEPVMSLNLFRKKEMFIYFQVLLKDKRVKYSTFHIQLLDASGNILECYKGEIIFSDNGGTLLYPLSFSNEKLKENKDLYLPNNTLTLNCKCAFTTGIVSEGIEKIISGCPHLKVWPPFLVQRRNLTYGYWKNKKTSIDLIRNLQENLESLYKMNMLCDTQLKTKTATFPAHKNILSARSPVFQAMFTHDMRERSSDCVLITDLSDDTIHRMLLYIYTAKMQDLHWESMSDLYVAADKYDILGLKKECSSFLKRKLCPDNVCELLVLADRHQDKDLKTDIEKYVGYHREICDTDKWKVFRRNNLMLAEGCLVYSVNDGWV